MTVTGTTIWAYRRKRDGAIVKHAVVNKWDQHKRPNRRLIRQWSILRTLGASRGRTTTELAHQFNVNSTTIRKDLETLAVSGFPVVEHHARSRNRAARWSLQGCCIAGGER
jgi:predicted HTH transcriptional regulator